MINGKVLLEMAEGPAAIRATIDDAGPTAQRLGARLRADGVRRVYVIGNGTSHHSSLAAAALYRRTEEAGDPAVVAMTAFEFRTYPPKLSATDVIVGISASGAFRDVIAVAEAYRGQIPVVGIVHVPDSPLTHLASDVVVSAGGPSDVPVMTKTFSATLVAAELLMLALQGGARWEHGVTRLRGAAEHAEAALAASAPLVERLAVELRDATDIFVVGSGLASIAAQEAALKLKEMAIVHAEAAEAAEMASGAATIVRPGTVVIGLAPAGRGRAATADVIRHAAEWGARILEVGPDQLVSGSDLIRTATDTEEDHAPLTCVAPVAALGYALARARGHNPDRPTWVERYHSQGLNHILGV